MKKFLLIAAACLGLCFSARAQALADVTIAFDYAEADWSDGMGWRLYESPVVATFPGVTWTVFSTGTMVIGTNYVQLSVLPAEHYFIVTAVNVWGMESGPSNRVGTPPAVPPQAPSRERIGRGKLTPPQI